MWYSGLACCIVLVLGSCLSLVPGLQQEDYPDKDLLVPVMEVIPHTLNFLKLKTSFSGFILLLANQRSESHGEIFQENAKYCV